MDLVVGAAASSTSTTTRWPIRTGYTRPAGEVRVRATSEHDARRHRDRLAGVARAASSRGGRIDRTILSPRVRINSFSHVNESILFDGVDVGRHARLRRAIIDKGVDIPAGMEIG